MDNSRRGGGQNERSFHQASQSRSPLPAAATQNSSTTGDTTQRYRPTPLNLATSTPRSMGVASNYSNYYQDPPSSYSASSMSSTLLAYGTDYGSDARTQTPGFGSYNAGMMMYNVPPQTAAQQAVYDTQQFTPRQHAAMQMMPSDVTSGYFASDASGGTSTSLQAPGQGSSTSYQHQNTDTGYPGSMSELQQPVGAGSGASQNRDADGAASVKWNDFRRQLGTVFHDVSNGQLERASGTLLELSKWLLPQVTQLGLHHDDQSQHEERLKLWNDFNNGWLALAFQQSQLMTSGQDASSSQRLMTKDQIEEMGDELVRLCDGLERHGLVDYQYGVWEEQIEAALEECLDLFPK